MNQSKVNPTGGETAALFGALSVCGVRLGAGRARGSMGLASVGLCAGFVHVKYAPIAAFGK